MLKFVLIFLALSQWLAIAQETNEYYEGCGKLNENYLNNFNNIAAIDEFPWIGRVYYKDKPNWFRADRYIYQCLAVLISKRHLLFAAHCVAKTPTENLEPFAVILGSVDQCSGYRYLQSPMPNYYEIDEIALHPNLTFDRHRPTIIVDNDIGIITLSTEVSYNAEVSPICLPTKEESSAHFVGQYLHKAGFTVGFAQPLNRALVLVTSLQKCRDMDSNVYLGDSYMCVIPFMEETNVFRNGALLMGVATKGFPAHPHNFYLIGLDVLQNTKTEAKHYVAVSIGPHIEWIRSNIAT